MKNADEVAEERDCLVRANDGKAVCKGGGGGGGGGGAAGGTGFKESEKYLWLEESEVECSTEKQ